jgi:isoleucyl-tRNA synthetase
MQHDFSPIHTTVKSFDTAEMEDKYFNKIKDEFLESTNDGDKERAQLQAYRIAKRTLRTNTHSLNKVMPDLIQSQRLSPPPVSTLNLDSQQTSANLK